jgi:hypothetical protein
MERINTMSMQQDAKEHNEKIKKMEAKYPMLYVEERDPGMDNHYRLVAYDLTQTKVHLGKHKLTDYLDAVDRLVVTATSAKEVIEEIVNER